MQGQEHLSLRRLLAAAQPRQRLVVTTRSFPDVFRKDAPSSLLPAGAVWVQVERVPRAHEMEARLAEAAAAAAPLIVLSCELATISVNQIEHVRRMVDASPLRDAAVVVVTHRPAEDNGLTYRAHFVGWTLTFVDDCGVNARDSLDAATQRLLLGALAGDGGRLAIPATRSLEENDTEAELLSALQTGALVLFFSFAGVDVRARAGQLRRDLCERGRSHRHPRTETAPCRASRSHQQGGSRDPCAPGRTARCAQLARGLRRSLVRGRRARRVDPAFAVLSLFGPEADALARLEAGPLSDALEAAARAVGAAAVIRSSSSGSAPAVAAVPARSPRVRRSSGCSRTQPAKGASARARSVRPCSKFSPRARC